MKRKNLFTFTCCFFAVICASQFACAGLIFESASGDPGTSGCVVSNYNFVMHRFELRSTTRVGSIGGSFRNSRREPTSIYGAIISLTSQNDRPNSNDLSTSDVLATTIIGLDRTLTDYYGKVDIVLKPGWYALAFGAGKFGATSLTISHVDMPHFSRDLSPQPDFNVLLHDHPYNPGAFIEVSQNYPSRFLMTTEIIPEPASFLLLGIGAIVLKRRKPVPNN